MTNPSAAVIPAFGILSGRRPRTALLLATTALTSVLAIGPAGAQPLPTGGSVAAGSVSIGSPSGTQLNITQTSQSAVVNWQSFSIGQGNSVNILQPNSSSALLNRVTGAAPSTIAGSLTANGQIYLVNPNGITITKYGVVNTGGGFVASTLGVSDADFMAGRRTFEGNGASAAVSNAGAITVGRGGYAALLGGSVSNAGNIVVPLGKVGLGAGERATLDFSGDGFLQVALPSAAGGTDALIRHSGTIKADGGRVIMSAATAREAARDAVNISGLVQARTIGGRSGAIVIGGGSGGRVTVSGRLDANSHKTTGGAVTVTGQAIALKGATIDVSGKAGGGTVNIGGGRQGTGSLQHADTLDVDATTVIRADATATGHGGNVVLWSDLYTTFAGTIFARGGAQGGNGGEAEVSGKAKLAYTGITDLSAAHGAFGTLLLDPFNVTISNDTGTVPNTSDSFIATAVDSIINAATLQTALETADVTVTTGGSSGSQAGNITVAAPLTWSTATTLNLTAAGAVTINAPITITGPGGLNITATAQAGITTSGLTFGNGASVTYAAGDTDTTLGQSFTLNSTAYTLVYTMEQLDAIDGKNGVDGSNMTAYGAGAAGNYALATDLNATGNTYTKSLFGEGRNFFSGKLDGLGHTITGLTINAPSTTGVGLVAGLSGTVSNIGMVGGSITGSAAVGGLVGNMNSAGATVQTSYATVTVTGTNTLSNTQVGGLVGVSLGIVQSSYATGAVTGKSFIGGLVGYNMGAINGSFATGRVTGTTNTGGLVGYNEESVSASYATGTVTGGDQTGGLLGTNGSGAAVATSYSTGVVSGTTNTGGLIGSNYSDVASSYWNTETSGQSAGFGSDAQSQSANITAKTTAELQNGVLPTGFVSPWKTGAGLYPYLSWQFVDGTTPQSVSGFAYKADGTVLTAATIAGDVDGKGYFGGTTSTGANGYYYFVVPQGTIASDGGVLTAVAGNAVKANSYRQGATGSVANLNLYAGALTVTTNATTLSSVASGLAGDVGAIDSTDLVFTTPGGVLTPNASTRVSIAASGDFGIDQSLVVPNDLLIKAVGSLSFASTGTVSSSDGDATLVAGTTFINDRGADAIAAENGRWLIYSVDPRGDTRSDLVYDFKQYGATYDGATPLPEDESGNGMVYSYAPTVTAELTGVSKTYDGDATATLASGNFSTTGAIDGDAVTFNYGAATYSDKNAATGLTVTATGISIATTTNGTAKVYGYALNSTSVFGSGTINARAVILSGTQTYDGTTTALGENLSVTNLVLDDTVTVSGTGTMAGKDVGAQALTSLTGLTLGNSNYTVAGGSGSVTVTPRAVILSGTQTYNGTTNALGENLSVTNLVLDDTVTVSGTGTMAGKDVGPRALTSLAGLVLGDSNYTLLGGSGSVTVIPANVTVTARSGVSVFRSSPPNPGLSATGLQGGEGIEVLTGLSNSFGITSTSSLAGSPYTLTVEGTLGNPNYNLVGRVDGTWTIIAPATDPSQRASTVVNNTALFTSWLIGVTLFDGFGNGPVTSDGSGATSFIVDRRFSRDWCEPDDDGLCTVRH